MVSLSNCWRLIDPPFSRNSALFHLVNAMARKCYQYSLIPLAADLPASLEAGQYASAPPPVHDTISLSAADFRSRKANPETASRNFVINATASCFRPGSLIICALEHRFRVAILFNASGSLRCPKRVEQRRQLPFFSA